MWVENHYNGKRTQGTTQQVQVNYPSQRKLGGHQRSEVHQVRTQS